MIFDQKGLPRDNGATDMMDSCRLAGILAVIGHSSQVPMEHYLAKDENGFIVGVRHPDEYKSNNYKNFTRDQLIPLAAGLYAQNGVTSAARKLYDGAVRRRFRAQNTERDVPGSTKTPPDGADILNPGHMLMLAKAGGKDGFWVCFFGYPFVVLDIIYNAIFTSTRESNQLICGLSILGPNWLRFYKMVTPNWKKAVMNYWDSWRDEKQLGEDIVRWMLRF